MRYLFLLFLFLLAPLATLHSAQDPPVPTSGGAQLSRGRSYENAQNYSEARKWYLKAAEQGHARAKTNLGALYHSGKGVERDPLEAREWWLKAAEQGEALAQHAVGAYYYAGRGVAQDYVEARKWFLKAAEQGNADAQFSLGGLYDRGQGVAQNHTMAYAWYNIAAAQGHADAEKDRDGVAAKLDAASLAEAQKLSKEYFKRYVEPFRPSLRSQSDPGPRATSKAAGKRPGSA